MQGLLVGPGQVGDLVGDGPPRGRGGLQPGDLLQAGHDGVQHVPLGGEVGKHRRRVRHAASLVEGVTDRPYGQPRL